MQYRIFVLRDNHIEVVEFEDIEQFGDYYRTVLVVGEDEETGYQFRYPFLSYARNIYDGSWFRSAFSHESEEVEKQIGKLPIWVNEKVCQG